MQAHEADIHIHIHIIHTHTHNTTAYMGIEKREKKRIEYRKIQTSILSGQQIKSMSPIGRAYL